MYSLCVNHVEAHTHTLHDCHMTVTWLSHYHRGLSHGLHMTLQLKYPGQYFIFFFS